MCRRTYDYVNFSKKFQKSVHTESIRIMSVHCQIASKALPPGGGLFPPGKIELFGKKSYAR